MGRPTHSHPDPLAIVTIVVALYGAVLSTYVLLRNIAADERRLLVTTEPSLTPQCPRADTLGIRVTNEGRRPVTILDVTFVAADSNIVSLWRVRPVTRHHRLRLYSLPEEAGLPTNLADAQTVLYSFSFYELLRARPRPVAVIVRDSEYHEQRIPLREALATERLVRHAVRKTGLKPDCSHYN